MEPKSDTSTLESEATKEYLAKEAENIKRAEMSSRPPNWYNLQLNDPRIGKEFAVPEFNTEEGMRVRGLLDEKGDATPFGEDYLMLEDRGLLKDGRMTQKGVAFITPTEDLLPTSKMDAGTNLDFNDPENLEKFSLWQIREKAGLNKKPEDEGNAILNIFKGVNEMRKSIGVAISPPSYTEEQEETIRSGGIMDALGEIVSPKGGYTKEQRIAALAKAGEGAAETAVTSSGKLGTFLDKNVINPARKALGATDEQIEVDNLAGKFLVDTRDALYEDVTAEKTWDAITSTTQAVEMRAKALEDYTRQLGPVEGAKKMAEVDRGAYATGGMVTDVPGMAVTAATFGAGKLFSLGKTMKAAEALKNASAANTNLTKLGTAATLIGKNIDEATASASIFQKQLDDALLVGNKEAADLAKSQLDEVTATIGESQARLGLVNDGIKLNESVVQSASTKIDDLNAPSMVGRKLASGAVKKVADAADALGNGFLWTNRKLRAIERGIGMGRLPYLVHAAGIATLGTAYKAYGAIRVGSLVAAPLLKKSAAFSNIVGDEMLQLTSSSPFWRRVAANEDAGRMTKAFGGLMDYTTPITRGVVGAAKGTAQALPAMTMYEAINSQGLDENAMERAGAGALVFGSFGRAIGSRNNWNQVKNNEFYNFRNKVRAANPEAFQQFESVPYRDVKQFASSIDAAYPGMFDSWNFVKEGNSKFDPVNKQATINYNDRAGIVKAAAAHEALHGIQFKHQSDGAVASLMLGDETRKGLVRNTDGSLDPEFKQFWDEYNSRLDAQGLPKIDINDAAIEYFTDNGAQTLFEDVLGGSVYKASQKTPLRRSIESVFKSTMAATPIVKNLHFKLGGATDNLGRMVDGSGLLAKGMKELPEVKAMIRNMYRESAGLPKQATKPQIIKDAPSQDPKHYKGGEIIRKANEEAVQGGTPLPDNVLNPDANGNGFGYLTDGAIKRLEESGVIADGDFAGVIAINSAMGTPSSYLLTNKPIEQGRSVQVEGITSNNIVPINWELKNGRLYLVGMDMVQLKLNIAKATKSSIAKKLGMKYADILNDIDNSALLHAKNQTTDAYFQSKDPKNWEKRKNFINSVQGLLTESQKKINPLFDKRNLNKTSGIYRTFAWDRLGDKIQMTGEVAIPYGQNSYYSLRDNLMPQPPRMNRNGELVKESAEAKAKIMPERKPVSEVIKGFLREEIPVSGVPEGSVLANKISTGEAAVKEVAFGPGAREKMTQVSSLLDVMPSGTSVNASVYHETSLSSGKNILTQVVGRNARSRIYVAPSLDLALGQKGAGVIIEFDPNRIQGSRVTGIKAQVSEVTGFPVEYVVEKVGVGAVQSIIFPSSAKMEQFRKSLKPGLESRFNFQSPKEIELGVTSNGGKGIKVETGQSRFMPKSRKKQSGEVRRSTFEGSPKQPKNNNDLANSISPLLSGAASRQMQREDQNENNYSKLQSNVIASVEDSLSNQERKKTLSVLGENSWNYNTSGKFVEKIADWVVSPKSVSPRLHEIISKTWSGLSKKLDSNTVVISLRSSLAPRVSIRKVTVMKSLPVSAPVDYDGKIEIPKYSPTTDESKQIPMIKSSLYASDDEQLPTIIPSANLEEIPKIEDPAKNNEIIASSISVMTSEWIVKNKDNNDAPFAIADKNNGSIMFFNKNGHLVSSVPALFGRKKGDDIITTGEVSHRTPAGRFDAKRYDSEDYGPSLRFDRVGTNNFLIHRIPSKSITATPEQRRKALKSQDAQDNRITSGCINLDPDAVTGAISHFENGGILYILPETNEGKSKSSAFRNIPQIKDK